MSMIALNPNASGTGVFTIASPNGNTDRTLTLPDAGGTVLTSSSDIPAANLTGSLPAGMGGKVLQVVNETRGTQKSTTSTSFVTTDWSLSITPSLASSKILLFGTFNGYQNAASYLHFTVYRGGINLGDSAYGFGSIYGNTGDRFSQISVSYLDSPASASSVTYTVYFRVGVGTGYMNLNTGEKSTLTLMEIAA
jgi:hypothetical protein